METITEDYVSLETAKLLKEKGFKGDRSNFYERGRLIDFRNYWWRITPKERYEAIEAPTLQMAMKWLREVHKIHIIAEPCLGEGSEPNLSFNRWFWTILKEEGEYKPIRKIDEFSTYEQACEVAIKYCLENLI